MNNIIDSYYKLPLGKYLDILDICEQDMEDIDRQAEINAILAGITVDEAYRMPFTEFASITAASHFLDEECPNVRRGIPKSYRLAGWELVAQTDIARLSTAQYVDFKSFCEDRRHNLPQILSCFLVPKGKDYNEGYDIAEIHAVLRDHLSVVDAMTLSAFFLNRWRNLMMAMLYYLDWKTRKIKDKETRTKTRTEVRSLLTNLAQSGDGSMPSGVYPRPRTNLGRLFGR